MSGSEHDFDDIERSLKKAAAALERARVPFLLGGSMAAWVRGGPEARKDLDLMVKPEDAELALEALVDAGMKAERPPENWLLKAWDGNVLIDLIFDAVGLPITDETIEHGDELNVLSIEMRVLSLDDVLATKLLALDEHFLNYESALQISRALREQVNWEDVRRRTYQSPYARAFFFLLEELTVLPKVGAGERHSGARIRVVSDSEAGQRAAPHQSEA